MNTIAQLGRLAAQQMYKSADRDQKSEDELGSMQQAYVADAVGADSHAKALKQVAEHEDVDEGLINALIASGAASGEPIQRRIRHGASYFAESPKARMVGRFDPTQLLTDNPDYTLTGLIAGTGKRDEEREELVKERYRKVLKKYQDKLDPGAELTERDTPWHRGHQGVLADLDSDIAGHKYMRGEKPWQYWLNPADKSGPLTELLDRAKRRIGAGMAYPDSTLGRFGMGAGTVGTLGLLPLIAGGEEAQQSLRRSAAENEVYSDVAAPDTENPKVPASEPEKGGWDLFVKQAGGDKTQYVRDEAPILINPSEINKELEALPAGYSPAVKNWKRRGFSQDVKPGDVGGAFDLRESIGNLTGVAGRTLPTNRELRRGALTNIGGFKNQAVAAASPDASAGVAKHVKTKERQEWDRKHQWDMRELDPGGYGYQQEEEERLRDPELEDSWRERARRDQEDMNARVDPVTGKLIPPVEQPEDQRRQKKLLEDSLEVKGLPRGGHRGGFSGGSRSSAIKQAGSYKSNLGPELAKDIANSRPQNKPGFIPPLPANPPPGAAQVIRNLPALENAMKAFRGIGILPPEAPAKAPAKKPAKGAPAAPIDATMGKRKDSDVKALAKVAAIWPFGEGQPRTIPWDQSDLNKELWEAGKIYVDEDEDTPYYSHGSPLTKKLRLVDGVYRDFPGKGQFQPKSPRAKEFKTLEMLARIKNIRGETAGPEYHSKDIIPWDEWNNMGDKGDDWANVWFVNKFKAKGFTDVQDAGDGNYKMKDPHGNPVEWDHETNSMFPATWDPISELEEKSAADPMEKMPGVVRTGSPNQFGKAAQLGRQAANSSSP